VCACAWSQVATSQITGVVKDAAGAAVAGAQINIIQEGTGNTRTEVSMADGTYVLAQLAPGTYRIQVTKQGFKQSVHTNIILNVASSPEINIGMVAGASTEQVLVEETGGMVGQAGVTSAQTATDVPLNGRQVTDLVTMQAGAVVSQDSTLNGNSNYPTQNISVGGGLTGGTTYLLDGASNNDPFNNQSLPMPFPDAMQQLKIQTGFIPAQFGHHAAAAVNMVTKGGGNQIHGDAFEFIRNGDLNARDYFANARDSLKRNQFGGVIGGAIKKNKLFFFMAYQGTIVKSNPPSTTSYIPTAQMLTGDFTTFASAACQGKNYTLADGFVGNKINPALFSPAAVALAKFLPTSLAGPCGTITYGISSDTEENQGIGKVDYKASAKQQLFFRWLISRYAAPVILDPTNVLTANKAGLDDQAQTWAFGDTYTFNSNLINSFHLAAIRSRVDRNINPYFSPGQLGSNTYSPIKGFTDMSVGSGFSLGTGANNPGYFNSTDYQVAEDMNWQKGKHQIQYGFQGIRAIMNTVNNRLTNGTFTFSTVANSASCTLCTGLSMADLMMGNVSGGFSQGTGFYDNDRSWIYGLYIQDNWKVSRTFAISYGVRFEPFLPETNWNQYVEHFNQGWFNAGTVSKVYPNAPAGMMFPGDTGYPGTSNVFSHKKQFAPRISMVWDPKGDGKMTLRASYGIFYDTPPLFFMTRFSNNPPWGANLSESFANFDNPWASYAGGNPFPGAAQLNKNCVSCFPLAGTYVNMPLHPAASYTQQWSMIFERQMNRTLMIGGGLFGNTTTHLWTSYEADPAMPVAGATLGAENANRYLNTLNPAEGKYYGTLGTLDPGGKADYEALQLRAEQRMSHGFAINVNYSWAHCISDPATQQLTGPSYDNPADRAGSGRGNCASDRRQVFNLTPTFMTPNLSGKLAKALIGRWSVSLVLRLETGNYTSVTSGSDLNLSGIGSQRPNDTLQPVYAAQQTPGNASAYAVNYLNNVSATVPSGISKGAFSTFGIGTGQWGNLGVYNIENPGMVQIDGRISRVFHVSEHKTIDLRWEVFNIPNRVNFGAPNTTLNSGQFGQITSDQSSTSGTTAQAGDPRMMQGAIKFTF